MGITNAMLHLLLKATITLSVEGVAKEDRCVAIMATHDCYITRGQVFNIVG
jgi:hypothetical protein